jgi:exosome complex exonuclease DIS3/RRP44
LVTFKRDHRYDPETYEIAVPVDESGKEVRIGVFDRVIVEITVEKDRSTQRGRVRMTLVEPLSSASL